MADFLFLTLKWWFYSCMQTAKIADVYFYSLWQAPTPQRQKTRTIVSTGKKYNLWLVRCSFLTCEENQQAYE